MTMETMINKAFILSKTSLPPFSNWMSCELQNGMFLYYDKKLPVASNSRKSVILIGDAWQIDSERAKPEEIIHNLNGNERPEVVFSIESTWSGRYILIVGDWLYLDAIGSMACFYGNGMVSNSINLIRNVGGGDISYPDIKHGQAPDFLLGPYTLYEDIMRLLPSQILRIASLKPEIRPIILATDVNSYLSYEERLQEIEQCFINSLKSMKAHFPGKQFCVAITGGHDSRVTLAMLQKSGIEYKGFTFWHDKISKQDKCIPKKLARVVGIKYIFIGKEKRVKDFEWFEKQQIHSGGLTAERTWESKRQIDELKDGHSIVIIRSSIFEISCNRYHFRPGGFNIYGIYPNIASMESNKKSVSYWLNMVEKDKVNSIIRNANRLYYDMRLGCWLSSTEQTFDMFSGVIPIQLCNCRRIIALLMGFSEEQRKGKQHEKQLTNHVFPPFAKVPYDEEVVYFSDRIISMLGKIKTIIWRFLNKKNSN